MRHSRKIAWILAGVLCCGVLAVVGAREQHAAPDVRLRAGSAWVASNRAGHLTLLDGASKEVAARREVAAPGTKLVVAQQDSTVYAVNRTDHTLVRVDGATFEISDPAAPLPGTPLSVFPTPGALLALGIDKGEVATLDPRTLRSDTATSVLAPATAPDLAAVDTSGTLWAVDDTTGDLVWLRDGKRDFRQNAATKGATRVVATADAVALVDAQRRTASLLDHDGQVQREIQLPSQQGEAIAVSGLPGEPGVLVSLSSRGGFLACRFASGCTDPRLFDTTAMGPAVTTAGHTFVPDHAHGRVWILRDGASEALERRLFDGPVRFELFERDGIVFYNDPESDRAGVIGLDGQVHPISKYDPVDPDKGAIKVPDENRTPPPPDQVQPPNQNQQPNPSQPPVPGNSTLGPGRPEQLSIQQSPPNPVQVGTQVELRLAGAAVVAANWDFGDGTTGNGAATNHTWSRAGTFVVSAVATPASGRTATASATVVVQDRPSTIVRLQVSPSVPVTGSQVSFSAEVTGTPQSWQWSILGGGSLVATSNQEQFGHVFTTPGGYLLTARMTTDGVVHERSQLFTVGLPVRSFSCGETVRASARLAGSVTCPGTALSLSSNDIYLDLSGHAVSTSNPQQSALVLQNAANATITNGTAGLIQLTNTDNVSFTNVQSELPLLSQARNTRFSGGRLTGSTLREIQASQVSFTGVTIASTAQLACQGLSRCEFVNSDLSFTGPDGVLGCGDAKANVISLKGGRGTFASLGCATLLVADVHDLTTRVVGWKVDIRRSTIHPIAGGVQAKELHVEGNTFSGTNTAVFFNHNQTDRLTGVIRNNTFTRMNTVGLFLNFRGPVDSLLVENNTITGNAIQPGQLIDWCANQSVRGGMHVCAARGGNTITLTRNRMTNNNGRALFADDLSFRDGGGNTGGGETCTPAICS